MFEQLLLPRLQQERERAETKPCNWKMAAWLIIFYIWMIGYTSRTCWFAQFNTSLIRGWVLAQCAGGCCIVSKLAEFLWLLFQRSKTYCRQFRGEVMGSDFELHNLQINSSCCSIQFNNHDYWTDLGSPIACSYAVPQPWLLSSSWKFHELVIQFYNHVFLSIPL